MQIVIDNKTYRSPNHDSREGQPISFLVLHYTGMPSGVEALERLCDPDAKVSAHYVVEEDGRIFQLVDEAQRAWHAGKSHWRGVDNVNAHSIGVEIVNPGHEFGYRAFPKQQMDAVMALCKDIRGRYHITPRNVVGHSDVAPDRKEDPGELFPWALLAAQGVGAWPSIRHAVMPQSAPVDIDMLQAALIEYGYGLRRTRVWDEATKKTVIAFQRHFRPGNICGEWDAECDALLRSLLIPDF